MQIAVKASSKQKAAFLSKKTGEDLRIYWVTNTDATPAADAYFDLCFEEDGWAFEGVADKPVFVNAVIACADQLPANAVRINAWEGFLNRDVMEIASKDTSQKDSIEKLLAAIGWQWAWAPDTPGMIAARIIAMIINEAYFALGEGVSTKPEIDIAMKLGTNYPFGPFEWAEKIGLNKICTLLEKLCSADARYSLAPALAKEWAETRLNNIIEK